MYPESASTAARLIRCFLTFCALAFSVICSGQATRYAGTFYPSASHHYTLSDGLPNRCISEVIIDSLGRMHIAMCFHTPGPSETMIMSYDGTTAYPSKLDLGVEPNSLSIDAIDSHQRFLGRYGFLDSTRQDRDGVFIYDPVAETTITLDAGKFGNEGLMDLYPEPDGFLALTSSGNNGKIYWFSDLGESQIVARFKFNKSFLDRAFQAAVASTRSDYWVVDFEKIYQISKTTGKVIEHSVPGTTVRVGHDVFVGPGDSVWIKMTWMPPMLWDPVSENLVAYPYRPEGWDNSSIIAFNIARDQRGNVVVTYQNEQNVTRATLVTSDGQLYDYSRVITHPGDPTNRLGLTSEDFMQSAIISHDGFIFSEVTEGLLIQRTPTIRNTRAIAEMKDHRLIINEPLYGLQIFDGANLTLVGRICEGSVLTFDLDWSVDPNGVLWSTSGGENDVRKIQNITRYNPIDGSCETFNSKHRINRFILLPDSRVLAISNGYLYTYTAGTDEFIQVGTDRIAGSANDMFLGTDPDIWVAASTGLYRIDNNSWKVTKIDLQTRPAPILQRIQIDEKGRLWLGSMNVGLIIYDPSTGEEKLVDMSKGLLNNIVPSILQDDEGIMWVGTYDGINLVSPEGEVIGKVTEADGLSENECNRWSQCKLSDGRLAFGAINGVNIIDPERWKAEARKRPVPRIYLTHLYTNLPGENDSKLEYLDTYHSGERITLPASNRNIQIGYCLSDYAAPEKSTFVYKFDLPDADWQFIGTQRLLTLNSLPPGQYNVIIRGKDGNGKWSDPPIRIALDVKRFFYQQWWFYALCSLPFIAGLLLWMYRQRQARKYLEQEVLNRTATIREQSERLQELDHVKSQLYTNITHEFRTPLTVIMGMAEQLHARTNEVETREGSEVIERSSANLLNLVNQMLDLRKLESGAMSVHLVQDDLVRFLRFIAESFRSLASVKQIHFRFLTDEEKLLCDFDQEKLRQIVANLLSNAIKFTPEGGDVFLQMDKVNDEQGEWVVIKVKDTGIGIPEHKLPFIFERFYQVDDSTTRRGEGTGIGLTLASELAKLMQGDLVAISHPGKGSTFTLRVPYTTDAEPPESASDIMPATLVASFDTQPLHVSITPETGPGMKPTVLIVEDNADVVHYLVLCLKDQYEVQIAMNGEEGIETAIASVPDLIVSDVMMPIRDGFELCQTLKQEQSTSHIPIILLTAKADVESRLAGLRRGADAYLAKPFHKQELLIVIDQLITLRQTLQKRYGAGPGAVLAETEDPGVQIEDAFVLKFNEAVIREIGNDQLDAMHLARILGLSRSQLHRKLKAVTGKTTMELVKEIRLSRARELLRDPALTISEVGYDLGFKYPETFTRAFQEAFGVTPSEWRERE